MLSTSLYKTFFFLPSSCKIAKHYVLSVNIIYVVLTVIFIVIAKTNLPNFKTGPCQSHMYLSPASNMLLPACRVIPINGVMTISDFRPVNRHTVIEVI